VEAIENRRDVNKPTDKLRPDLKEEVHNIILQVTKSLRLRLHAVAISHTCSLRDSLRSID
jgi:hypothetical protein